MAFFSLLRRNKHERPGFLLYGAAVIAARDPYLYVELGVPDTLDGRFDLIGLYSFLLIRRLRMSDPPGPALAQAVFDAMFSDMDINLREMGVGDLGVSRRIRAMWEAFHGRATVYDAAIVADDMPGLVAALEHNVWRVEVPTPGGTFASAALARVTLAQDACLANQDMLELSQGVVDFLPAQQAAR